MRRLRNSKGFTLLEVMVAVAILALALTAIFASEAGAVKMSVRSRMMGTATLLARCKMGEIEEQVAAEGLPAIDDTGSDACCEGAEVDGFTCDWEIIPIVLPDNMFAPEEGAAGAGDLEGLGSPTPAQGPNANPALAAQAAQDQLAAMDPTQIVSGNADVSGLTSMALGFVFPILKPSFENQIRRATVTIKWREGSGDHSFDVTQYLVSDQPIPTDQTGAQTGATPDQTQQPPPGGQVGQ